MNKRLNNFFKINKNCKYLIDVFTVFPICSTSSSLSKNDIDNLDSIQFKIYCQIQNNSLINRNVFLKDIGKKIKKLNEFQFIQLCMDVLYKSPLEYWDLETLELLFKRKTESRIKEVDKFPFDNDDLSNRSDDQLIITKSVKLNCTKKLNAKVQNLLAISSSYPEDYLNELLILSKNIETSFFQQIHSIKTYFENHVIDNQLETNTDYYIKIIDRLNDFEDELHQILNDISNKILNINNHNPVKGNFELNLNETLLEKLYQGLKLKGFIDVLKTTYVDFKNVFTLDWDEHNSFLSLEMDHPQTDFFFNEIKEKLNIKISRQQIELSQKIKNKNGFINAQSLYSSSNRSKKYSEFPKNSEDILEILENVIKKG